MFEGRLQLPVFFPCLMISVICPESESVVTVTENGAAVIEDKEVISDGMFSVVGNMYY